MSHTKVAQPEWLTSLGAAIRAARNDIGWTQSDVAVRVGLTRESVANIEAGRQNMSATTLAQFVAILDVQPPGWNLTTNPLRSELTQANAEITRLRAALGEARDLLSGALS